MALGRTNHRQASDEQPFERQDANLRPVVPLQPNPRSSPITPRDIAHSAVSDIRQGGWVWALYHVVITRMRHDQRTRDYVARRLTEGKTMGEIARILKRYVAREVFKHLPHPA